MAGAWQALGAVGLLPADAASDTSLDLDVASAGADLLEVLIPLWLASARRCRGAARVARERIADRLQQWHGQGARLTWGVPGAAGKRLKDWLGPRIAWWPCGLPNGRLVGVVSSRLGRDLSERHSWFAALRTACMHLDPRGDLLVTARSVATQRFAQRAADLFGLRALDVAIDNQPAPAPRWGQRLLAAGVTPAGEAPRLWLSPPCTTSPQLPPRLADRPPADRAVFSLSDRLIVLSARPHGNVQQLVDCRLAAADFPPTSLYLALGEQLVPTGLATPWMESGAVGWHLLDAKNGAVPTVTPPWLERSRCRAAPVRKLPGRTVWPLLTHWTRHQPGPWPDEPESEYLDDLILDRRGADHSAFAALWRIVQTRRLIATSTLIPGPLPMVCFSEVPLADLPQLRSFRCHLSRWDFELYGICIDRRWLQDRGTRPVQYGDRELRESLPESERPFFQQRVSRTRSGQHIDWSLEREWRHPGDLLLQELPADAALLFVPEVGQARHIARISPWPVIVLP